MPLGVSGLVHLDKYGPVESDTQQNFGEQSREGLEDCWGEAMRETAWCGTQPVQN